MIKPIMYNIPCKVEYDAYTLINFVLVRNLIPATKPLKT